MVARLLGGPWLGVFFFVLLHQDTKAGMELAAATPARSPGYTSVLELVLGTVTPAVCKRFAQGLHLGFLG